MPITLLHTADWHLGHALHGASRRAEHDRLLAWLLDVIERERPHALLHAGDVFDAANPPAYALSQWYGFLAEAARRRPGLQVVAIGGNHDSASRLDAPAPVLRALRVHVVGALPRREDGMLDAERLLVPLEGEGGARAAWVAAVPFLRPVDVALGGVGSGAAPRAEGGARSPDVGAGGSDAGGDPLVQGVQAIYAEACAAALARRRPDEAIVLMGHLYLAGGLSSEQSERRILGGNLHALPPSLFPREAAYTALGHLHRPQRAGGHDAVRYAGSPLPLSFPEASHPHEVLLVTLAGAALAEVRPLRVPRTRELLRVPAEGALPLEDLLARLRALPPLVPGTPDDERPLLEAHPRLAAPEPALRRRLDEALEGRAARLVAFPVTSAGSDASLGSTLAGARRLVDLSPSAIFALRWRRDFAEEATPALVAAFEELRAVAEGGAEA